MGVRVPNPSSASADTLAIPARADGSPYRMEMIADGGWSRCYGDAAAEMLGFLIPGYEGLPASDRLQARIRHAVDQQVVLQAYANADAVAQGTPPGTPAQRDLLTSDRATQPTIPEWDSPAPLILVDAFYAPFSTTPAPTSPGDTAASELLRWLRPAAGEMPYLVSLHEAGAVTLGITKDEVA